MKGNLRRWGSGGRGARSGPSNQAPLPNCGGGDLPGPQGRCPVLHSAPVGQDPRRRWNKGDRSPLSPNFQSPQSTAAGKWGAGRGECGCSLPSGTVRKTGAQRGSVTVHGQGRRGNEQAGHVRLTRAAHQGVSDPRNPDRPQAQGGQHKAWETLPVQLKDLRPPGPSSRVAWTSQKPPASFRRGPKTLGAHVPALRSQRSRSCRHLALMSSRTLAGRAVLNECTQPGSEDPELGLSWEHRRLPKGKIPPNGPTTHPQHPTFASACDSDPARRRPELEMRKPGEALRPGTSGSRPSLGLL